MSNHRTRIKICGMTTAQDASRAVELGVDAIGMIMYADSPRCVSVAQAQQIRRVVPAFVTLVGVFVDCDATQLEQISEEAGLDLIQLHGNETDQFGASLSRPYIKAIRAKSKEQVGDAILAFPNARAILLDPYKAGQHGGTGLQLDTTLWPENADHDLILAGGLNPHNVAALRDQLRPFAVDLNSGVEQSPGRKDYAVMTAAVKALSSNG